MTTSRISGSDSGGETILGTGFFFQTRPGDGESAIFITNKHVIQDVVSGEFLLHLQKDAQTHAPSFKSVPIKITDFRKWWVTHPNPDIDLAGALLDPMIESAGFNTDEVVLCCFSLPHIASDAELETCCAIEDVAMVGYPNGLWDEFHNLPIIQRGTSASHPGIPFGGEPYGIIDMACVCGSSGSPIISHNEGGVIRADHPSAQIRGKQILLGILSDVYTSTLAGDVRAKAIPTKRKMVAEIAAPMHLGRYIRASEIMPLVEKVETLPH